MKSLFLALAFVVAVSGCDSILDVGAEAVECNGCGSTGDKGRNDDDSDDQAKSELYVELVLDGVEGAGQTGDKGTNRDDSDD